MKPFEYARPATAAEALSLLERPGAKALAGGTNLVDLLREGIETPDLVVDVGALGWDTITTSATGHRVGAGVTNTDLAAHIAIRTDLPLVSEAVVSGATGQLRNMATVGGNLLQRSRCSYFYDHAAACNKRTPGAGCDARDGFHRGAAILGTSEACISAHPSDLCLALVALDAVVHLRTADGTRAVALESFHLPPGTSPDRENVLLPGELVEAVDIPLLPHPGYAMAYRKVRDRASYAFALVSVAAAVHVEDGVVTDVRLALGGVGTRPWRARLAEEAMRGRPATEDTYRAAIRAELDQARPTRDVVFKVGLTESTVVAVLRKLTATSETETA